MKGNIMAKRSTFGSIMKKRLSDITNSLPQPKSPTLSENLPPNGPNPSSTKDHIDYLFKHLEQENMALMKLLGDKNKIIELRGIELQKIRVSLQKMQLQNWNLALTNSHILAELNLGKEKFKALQHELVCKDALLKAKNLELEGQLKLNGQNNDSLCGDEAVVKSKSTKHNNKACNGGRRRPLRSQSMGPLTTSQQVTEKENVDNKRQCLRRQSARFKPRQQEEPTENLFEIKDIDYSITVPPERREDNAALTALSIRKVEEDENCTPRSEPQASQRTSFGRPSRKAAEKVQSYKEIPLNIKMRRPE